MRTKLGAAIILSAVMLSFTIKNTGEGVLRLMFARFSGHWHKALTFKQTTERYRNDSLISTQSWRENMLYPDKLRIDIAPFSNHNTLIFRSDSTYRIQGGVVKTAAKQENDLMFLLGGMYAVPIEKAMDKLKALGYDLSKAYEDTWKGKSCYVMGANFRDEKVNQLWVDKTDMYVVRMIEYNNSGKHEAWFDDHLKLNGAWTETKVHFFMNDKLLQVESYDACMPLTGLDERLFDPQHYLPLAGK